MSTRLGGIKQVMLGLNGMPEWIGTIAATTTGVDNGNTGTPFTIPPDAALLLEVDAEVYVGPILKTGATPMATSQLKKMAAGDSFYCVMREGLPILLARTASGTANVKVFQVR